MSRNFKWNDLALKIRENVIDKMDAKTRCKFVQCSKECEKQAKSSNNYLYAIKILEKNEEKKKMLVIKFEKDGEDSQDYSLDFLKVRGEEKMTVLMYRKYNDQGGEKKWMKLVHENPEVLRRKYFMEYLETYKNSIKMLQILDKDFAINDLNIKDLKTLEILDFGGPNPRIEMDQLNAFVDF
ncbi:unnamed protein product [Caenorhabditis angaria]|uniref:F-box domain-containing protein n=1 Tax=Caenorhabditis angaria TaxID=860376 RepID=A0A9P1I7U1_9PELO|nr:unnamed protein product [Caenorhabditis angaria]